ncbi:MAG: hypothetical protein J07AB43_14850 [Candidatus Nanosalina sp. J07AB43]|nr:MAG: hypothetical protein J07AB43_14850 [Candidatus Nanosalina sp. J07AB43]
MFNIGSNDKEELEENMEEIKNLIGKNKQDNQGDSRGSNSAEMQEKQGSGFGSADGPQADIGSPQASSSQEQGNLGNMSTDSGNENPSNRGQSLTSQREESNPQQSQAGQNSLQEQEDLQRQDNLQSRDQPRQDNVLNRDESGQEQESPDVSNQEESVPDEPLFLREEEFDKIREMVEEMTYLTQEMDQKVKNMKRNVREEKDTSRDSRELSKAFDERRREIKSVIESSR